MTLKYKYSIFGNLLFFVFGLFLLFIGLDLVYFNTELVNNFINKLPIEREEIPKIAIIITLFLGFLTSTGFLKNLLSKKNYVLKVDEEGLTVNTGNIKKELSEIKIKWSDFFGIETRYELATLRWHGGNRGWTRIIAIKVKPESVQWPSVMIGKNRISFNKKDSYDEIIIDAWLNKSKKRIVKEVQGFAFNKN
jgi:hypothetical protein